MVTTYGKHRFQLVATLCIVAAFALSAEPKRTDKPTEPQTTFQSLQTMLISPETVIQDDEGKTLSGPLRQQLIKMVTDSKALSGGLQAASGPNALPMSAWPAPDCFIRIRPRKSGTTQSASQPAPFEIVILFEGKLVQVQYVQETFLLQNPEWKSFVKAMEAEAAKDKSKKK